MLFQDDAPPKLVGIARLAASSDLLEAKRQVEYLELQTRRFIGRGSGKMSEIYTVNPYRGCEYGCKYCYARYAHEFMELRDPELFERKIFAKQFEAAVFRAELRRLKPGATIWIGTATDPFQPAERRFHVTHRMLEAIADERELDIGITTKSDLVAHEAVLLARIARSNRIRVHLTITTLDERLARLLEPRAPRPQLRLSAVRTLSDAGIPVSVLAHPVMPLINDSEASLARVCQGAAKNGATSFSAAPLFLKPCSYRVFLPFLEQHFPHLVRRYRERFENSAFLKGEYPKMIAERVEKVRSRHKIAHRSAPEWPATHQTEDQMKLFPSLAKPPRAVFPGKVSALQRKVNRV